MLVTGYPKSGTTWFCLMLANALNVPYENLMEPGVHPREDWQRKLTKGGLPHHSFSGDVGGEIVFHHDPARLEHRKDGEYAIYVVRDGRDVIVSFYYYLNKFRPTDTGRRTRLREWIQDMFEKARFSRFVATRAADWANDVRLSLALKPDLVVRYEDLNRNPVETLRDVFSKMNLPVEPQVIDRCVATFSFERMAGRLKGQEDNKSFFRKGIVGDWTEKFRDKDKETFKRIAGNVLQELGYENNADW